MMIATILFIVSISIAYCYFFFVKANKTKLVKGAEWYDLKGKSFNEPIVNLENCGDIHPFKDGPVFKRAHTLYINRCDKNFVYYWIEEKVFPSAKVIYLNSHPCDPRVFHRFKSATIFLNKRYQHYKERWAPNRENIVINLKTD